jgi:hypothetical protein
MSENIDCKKDDQSSLDIFKEQVEKMIINISNDELEYLRNEISNEIKYREFSELRVKLLKEELQKVKDDFEKQQKAKKKETKKITPEDSEESEESSEEEEAKPKKKNASRKTKKR